MVPAEGVLERLALFSHTSTKEGLTVTVLKDSNTYPTDVKVSAEA